MPLGVCSKRATTGIRNKALIVVVWWSGLRISEALALKPADLDPERATIRVLHGNGNKDRVVGFDPTAWAVLQRWLDTRAKLKLSGRRKLFGTLDGKPPHGAYVRNMLKRLMARIKERRRQRSMQSGKNWNRSARLASDSGLADEPVQQGVE